VAAAHNASLSRGEAINGGVIADDPAEVREQLDVSAGADKAFELA